MQDYDVNGPIQTAQAPDIEQLMQMTAGPGSGIPAGINAHTHEGYVPQGPSASPSHQAAQEARLVAELAGFVTYEQLQASLPPTESIRRRPDGVWVRDVWPHTGESSVGPDGKLYHVRERKERIVVLTLRQARQLGANGVEADYWNGFTWIRRGLKPERDMLVGHASQRGEIRYEEAGPADQARAVQMGAQQAASQAGNLVRMTEPGPSEADLDAAFLGPDPEPAPAVRVARGRTVARAPEAPPTDQE